MNPGVESYITMIDGMFDDNFGCVGDLQEYWTGAMKSLLYNKDFVFKDAYASGILEMSIDRGYVQLMAVILDYYQISNDLTLKQRLAVHLLEPKS